MACGSISFLLDQKDMFGLFWCINLPQHCKIEGTCDSKTDPQGRTNSSVMASAERSDQLRAAECASTSKLQGSTGAVIAGIVGAPFRDLAVFLWQSEDFEGSDRGCIERDLMKFGWYSVSFTTMRNLSVQAFRTLKFINFLNKQRD